MISCCFNNSDHYRELCWTCECCRQCCECEDGFEHEPEDPDEREDREEELALAINLWGRHEYEDDGFGRCCVCRHQMMDCLYLQDCPIV